MTKILYVEDDDDSAYMLSQRLQRRGLDVTVAGDAERGIAAALEERPDLILMDLGLPGMDGWEAARQLKGRAETSQIPIIAVSSHALPGDRERAFESGCDDYDTKPIELQRLLSKIEALLPAEPSR